MPKNGQKAASSKPTPANLLICSKCYALVEEISREGRKTQIKVAVKKHFVALLEATLGLAFFGGGALVLIFLLGDKNWWLLSVLLLLAIGELIWLVGTLSELRGALLWPKTGATCPNCKAQRSLVELRSIDGQKLQKMADEKMEAERVEKAERQKREMELARQNMERAKREREAQEKRDEEWVKNPQTVRLIATYRSELLLLYQKLQVLHAKKTAQLTSHQASEDRLARRGGNSSLASLASLGNWTLGELEDAQIEKEIKAVEVDIKEREDTIARYDRLKVKYQVTDAANEGPVSDACEKSEVNFCPKCGNRRQAGENFCSKCGNKF